MRSFEWSRVKVPDSIPVGLDADQTGPLNEWLASIPNGPGAVYAINGDRIYNSEGLTVRAATVIEWPAGPIRVDGTLNLVGRSDLAFLNLNIVRVAWPMLVPQLVLDHCVCLVFMDPYVQGSKAPGWTYQAKRESETAYRLEGSQFIDLIRPRAEQVWGDHLYFGKTARNPGWTRNVNVVGGVFGESARDPIAATACKDVLVEACTFGDGRTCVDMEPNGSSGGVDGLTVFNNEFAGKYGGLFAASVGSTDVGVVENVTLHSNTVPHGSLQMRVAGGERRSNFTVLNNVGTASVGNSVGVDGNRGCVMWFDGVTGQLVVKGNSNPVSAGRNMRFARFNNCEAVDYGDNVPADLA